MQSAHTTVMSTIGMNDGQREGSHNGSMWVKRKSGGEREMRQRERRE